MTLTLSLSLKSIDRTLETLTPSAINEALALDYERAASLLRNLSNARYEISKLLEARPVSPKLSDIV